MYFFFEQASNFGLKNSNLCLQGFDSIIFLQTSLLMKLSTRSRERTHSSQFVRFGDAILLMEGLGLIDEGMRKCGLGVALLAAYQQMNDAQNIYSRNHPLCNVSRCC